MNGLIGILAMLVIAYLCLAFRQWYIYLCDGLPVNRFYAPGICLLKLVSVIGTISFFWWVACTFGDAVIYLSKRI
jgi:hypothetical protein